MIRGCSAPRKYLDLTWNHVQSLCVARTATSLLLPLVNFHNHSWLCPFYDHFHDVVSNTQCVYATLHYRKGPETFFSQAKYHPPCRSTLQKSIFDQSIYSRRMTGGPGRAPNSSYRPPSLKTRQQVYAAKNRALLMYTSAVVRVPPASHSDASPITLDYSSPGHDLRCRASLPNILRCDWVCRNAKGRDRTV